ISAYPSPQDAAVDILSSGLQTDILSYVATLQRMLSQDGPEFTNPKSSILASVVASTVSASLPGVTILSSRRERPIFATSRPSRSDYRVLAPYFPMQQQATLLVVHNVPELARFRHKEQSSETDTTAPDGSSVDSAADKQSLSEDDDEGSIDEGEDERWTVSEFAAGRRHSERTLSRTLSSLYAINSSPAPPNVVSDYVSLASIFPDYQIFPPSIPIICMAEYQTIFGLLKSAVYQQRVCGISQPVVGLAFSPALPVIQVLFAWADHAKNNGL
ncbi:hypothetical protein BU15DRAFT_69676, partial [Melanogaster broomeanus]